MRKKRDRTSKYYDKPQPHYLKPIFKDIPPLDLHKLKQKYNRNFFDITKAYESDKTIEEIQKCFKDGDILLLRDRYNSFKDDRYIFMNITDITEGFDTNIVGDHTLDEYVLNEKSECVICYENTTSLGCKICTASFCENCFDKLLNAGGRSCPVCKTELPRYSAIYSSTLST